MKLITRAADCNIRTFMSCKFDNNLQALVIESEPTEEELFDAWEKISIEYLDLSGVEIPELAKKNRIHEVDLSIKACNLCFMVLHNAIDQNLLEEVGLDALPLLRQQGVTITWRNDIDDLKKQLASAEVRYKNKYVRLSELEAELKQIEAEASKPETVADFYRTMSNIEALMNVRISETETSLARFAVMVADYRRLIAQQSNS